ncbi:hypothetical protein MPLA_930040 [Mesorhizobium sp. ORS 3359]|nr:hypothetical protein MPLA_930040 [Mesorhizobium sp. ORS 3359]
MDADAHAGSCGGSRHGGHSTAQTIQPALSALVRFWVSGVCIRGRDLLADDHTARDPAVLTEFATLHATDRKRPDPAANGDQSAGQLLETSAKVAKKAVPRLPVKTSMGSGRADRP